MHLSYIRPSTQHRLTPITTWFNNNNDYDMVPRPLLDSVQINSKIQLVINSMCI